MYYSHVDVKKKKKSQSLCTDMCGCGDVCTNVMDETPADTDDSDYAE